MGRFAVAAIVALAGSLLVFGLTPRAYAEGCGLVNFEFTVQGEGVEGSVNAYAKSGIGCTDARKVVRKCGSQNRVKGWEASGTGLRFELRRGGKVIVAKDPAGAAAKCVPALPPPPRYKSCRRVKDIGPTGMDPADGWKIRVKGAGCREARRVVRRYGRAVVPATLAGESTLYVGRWRCTNTYPRVRCRAERAVLRFRDDG